MVTKIFTFQKKINPEIFKQVNKIYILPLINLSQFGYDLSPIR